MSRWLLAGAVVLSLWFFGSIGDASEPEGAPSTGSTATADRRPDSADAGTTHERRRDRRTSRESSGQERRSSPEPRTYLVTRIVDGDTLEIGTGDIVRLVGMDTPEVGECGFEKSSAELAALTLGKQVTLTVSDEDRDQYGRLLRYVDAGGLDAGLRLIQDGLAIARYDSRDGYGFHPREPRYIAADRANPDLRCSAPRAVAAVPAPGGACAPGYTPCIPPFPPDVDCADVDGPIRVTGSDPHGLDADGDGVACE